MKRLLIMSAILLSVAACKTTTFGGSGVYISSGFNETFSYGETRDYPHSGVDIVGPIGTPIIAAADGFVGSSSNYQRQTNSCGNEITLHHTKLADDIREFETRYCHMSDLLLTRGTIVKRGDVIGHIGQTGRVGSVMHVHFVTQVYSGPYIDNGGEPRRQFDPEKYVVGCYDPKIKYSTTKTVFTWPIPCKN